MKNMINNYRDIISFGGSTRQVDIYMSDHNDNPGIMLAKTYLQVPCPGEILSVHKS